MKKIITLFFLLALTMSINNRVFAQANSVGLNGSFIYSSISAAYTAIGGTISSPQLIELSSSYNGSSEVPPILLAAKTGSSSVNTVTIRPSAGANGLVLNGSVNNGVIRFDGCSYVYLDGRPGGVTSTASNYLTINNTLSTGTFNSAHAVLFAGTVRCKAQYLNANCFLSTAGARGVISIGGSVVAVSGNGNVIGNNVVRGGQRCIQVGGTVNNSNDTIRNNDVADYASLGIFTNLTTGLVMTNNRVHFTTALTTIATFLVGIQIQGNATKVDQNEIDNLNSLNANSTLHMANFGNGNRITRNLIHDNVSTAFTTNVVTGIQFSSSGQTYFADNKLYNLSSVGAGSSVICLYLTNNGAATDTNTIFNNRIYNISTTVDCDLYGILLINRSGNVAHINNNNISITDANSGSIGVFGIYTSGTFGFTTNVNGNYVTIGGVRTGGSFGVIGSCGIIKDNTDTDTAVYRQKNNNVQNTRTTGDDSTQINLGSYIENLSGVLLSIDSNVYHATDTLGGFAAGWVDTIYTNAGLAAYKAYANPHEQHTTFNNASKLNLTMNFEACPNLSQVTVEIRNSTSPYAVVQSEQGMAGGAITTFFNFDLVSNGVPYYIVVKSPNMIETWSAAPVTFTSNVANYNFTTSLSQAYGNNQKLVGGVPSVYQGDANQDGFVDGTDVIITYNDATAFVTSSSTDYNCDGTTDLTDIILAFNNGTNFVQRQRPPVLDIAPSVNTVETTDRISSVSSHSFRKVTNIDKLNSGITE